jgi:hypothetical protein
MNSTDICLELDKVKDQYENVKNLTDDCKTEVVTEEMFLDTHPILHDEVD